MKEKMAYIVVRDRKGNVVLKKELTDSCTIGRSSECEIRVDDGRLSRKHCELKRRGDGWVAHDLDSHNRTYVNGKAIKEQILHDGDVLEVGYHRVTFLTSKPTRKRAADPVRAGLANAEDSAIGNVSGWQSGSGDESSLFATRVMVDLPAGSSDESTLIGTGTIPSMDRQAEKSRAGHASSRQTKRWHIVAAAGIGAVVIGAAAWVYFG